MLASGTTESSRGRRAGGSRWWVQILFVWGAVIAYRLVRAQIEGPDAVALSNALTIVRVEEAIGIAHEQALQSLFAAWEPIARAWNVFYGLAHDLAAIGVLVLLWRRDRVRYRAWRNVAGWMLVLGLIGFATFPLTPPRLMPETHGFVDTGVEMGGVGPVQGATQDAGGNRYAAFPSLHVGRALWVAAAAYPVLRRRRSRAIVLAYPAMMLLATVVTANHWLLDGVAGGAALCVALALERLRQRRQSTASRQVESRPALPSPVLLAEPPSR